MYMIANVATMEAGSARLGMMVAETFLRKTKITRTTSPIVSIRVSLTSCTDARMGTDRSAWMYRFTDGGRWSRMLGSISRTASAMATMLLPGCLLTAMTTAGRLFDQLAALSFSTPSNMCATSSRRTAWPLRYDTIVGPY